MSGPDPRSAQAAGQTAGSATAGTVNVLAGLALLFTTQWTGDVLTRLLGLPIPGAILGIGLALLLMRFPMARSMQAAGRPLLHNLPLFLVPIGASLIDQADILRREGLVLLLAVVVSTMLTMVATQLAFTLALRWTQRT